MSSSTRQFTLIAVAGGMFASLMLIGIIGNVVKGNYLAIPVILFALLFAALFIWLGIWLNQRRIQMMFRKPTPDRLIEQYHATRLQARARKIPNADAVAAHLSGLAAAVYGQYDRAREELADADWDHAPAMYKAHRLLVLALIALLEERDRDSALELAGEARALEQTDSAENRPVLHDAVLVAAGAGDEGAIKRAQRAAGRGTGAITAVCAWALTLECERRSQPTEAAHFRKCALEAAPYFVGIQQMAGIAPPGA